MGKLLVKVIGAELVDDKLVIGNRPQVELVHNHPLRHLQERHLQSAGFSSVRMHNERSVAGNACTVGTAAAGCRGCGGPRIVGQRQRRQTRQRGCFDLVDKSSFYMIRYALET
jgi:hypothetical protein